MKEGIKHILKFLAFSIVGFFSFVISQITFTLNKIDQLTFGEHSGCDGPAFAAALLCSQVPPRSWAVVLVKACECPVLE